LLQNRYHSRLIEDDRDLLGVIRYIHANPLRAGLVPTVGTLGRFPWCGHGALTGERPARPFEAPTATLRLLADEPTEARRLLRHWMQQIVDSSDLSTGPLNGPPASEPRPDADHLTPGPLTELIQAVCTAHDLSPRVLASRKRNRAILEARSELARRATQDLGFQSREVARALGVSDAAISRALKRARL
jgi:hypothetical protein